MKFTAVLQRKDPRLPVYVVVPYEAIAPWNLHGTTVVEGSVNGYEIGRRTIKRWDSVAQSNWFIELTAQFCSLAGLSVGDKLNVSLARAATEVPAELEAALEQNSKARAVWDRLSEAKKRAIAEHVRSGKAPATRERRAIVAIQRLQ